MLRYLLVSLIVGGYLSLSAQDSDVHYDDLFKERGTVIYELSDTKEKIFEYKQVKAGSVRDDLYVAFVSAADVFINETEKNYFVKLWLYEKIDQTKVVERNNVHLSLDEFKKMIDMLDKLVNGCDYDRVYYHSSGAQGVEIWGSCKKYHVRFFPDGKEFSNNSVLELKKILAVLQNYSDS